MASGAIGMPIGTSLTAISSTSNQYLYGDAVFKRSGNIVTFKLNGIDSVPLGTSTKIFDIPSDCKPSGTSVETMLISPALDLVARLSFFVNGDARIYLYKDDNNGQHNVKETLTYVK